MNLSAPTVSFELIVSRLSAFWMNEPKHIIKAMFAMFESSSFDIPIPIGWPIAFSFGAAFSTWAQVVGASPSPYQRSCRQITGSGTELAESAKDFFVLGLDVDGRARWPLVPTLRS